MFCFSFNSDLWQYDTATCMSLASGQAGVMTSVFSDEERETITDLDHTIICPVSPGSGSEIR